MKIILKWTRSISPAPEGRETMRRLWRKNERLWLGGLTVLAALVLWEIVSQLEILSPVFISSPSQVAEKAAELLVDKRFWRSHVWTTVVEFFWGYLSSIVVGVPLGLAMGRYRLLRHILDPLVYVGNSTPRTALLPVLIIWFGLGMSSKAIIGFLGGVFPLIVNAQAGITNIDPSWLRVAQSFGAREGMIFRQIILPGATPFLLAGLRLAFGRTFTGIILGEMYVATKGLGHTLMIAGAAIQMAEVFFVIGVIAVMGIGSVTLLRKFEERVESWRGHA